MSIVINVVIRLMMCWNLPLPSFPHLDYISASETFPAKSLVPSHLNVSPGGHMGE